MMDQRKKYGVFRSFLGTQYGLINIQQLKSNTRGSFDFVQKLQLEAKLTTHNGCVNSICWNEAGTRILSGSDDQHLMVTDPFTRDVLTDLHSNHKANIFAARFLPSTDDRQVVSCSGDGMIYHTHLGYDACKTSPFDCHYGTTYEITTLPQDPNSFLSCGEDGTVRWFDLRTKLMCDKAGCKEDVLINCRRAVTAMTVNPVLPFQLAVGCSDSTVRIYDRRMLGTRATGGYINSATAGIVSRFSAPSLEGRSHRITSLAYSADGTEVLTSYSAEALYLFNLREDTGAGSKDRKTTSSSAYVCGTKPQKSKPSSSQKPESSSGPQQPAGQTPPIKRLRLRGDWSDTGPNARPESERTSDSAQQEPVSSRLMQHVSNMITQMMDGVTRQRQQQQQQQQQEEEEEGAADEQEPHAADTQQDEQEHPGTSGSDQPESSDSPSAASHLPTEESNTTQSQQPASHCMSGLLNDDSKLECSVERESVTVVPQAEARNSDISSSKLLLEKDVESHDQKVVQSSCDQPELASSSSNQYNKGTVQSHTDSALEESVNISSSEQDTTSSHQNNAVLSPLEIARTSDWGNIQVPQCSQHDGRSKPLKTDSRSSESPLKTVGKQSTSSKLTSRTTESSMRSSETASTSFAAEMPTVDFSLTESSATVSERTEPLGDDSSAVANAPPPPSDSAPASDIEPVSVSSESARLAEVGSRLLEMGEAANPRSEHHPIISLTYRSEGTCTSDIQVSYSGLPREPEGATGGADTMPPGGGEVSERVQVPTSVRAQLAQADNQPDNQPDNQTPSQPATVSTPEVRISSPPASPEEEQAEVPSGVTHNTETGTAPTTQPPQGARERQRRVGHSGPPTGDFQLYGQDTSSSSSDSSDDDDDELMRFARRAREARLSGRPREQTPLLERNAAAVRLQKMYRRRQEEREREEVQLLRLPSPAVSQVYHGHRNARTMIKEACFWGDDYVMSGSDCGHVFIWDRYSGGLVMLLEADRHVVNCLQPHPTDPILATSGIDYNVKIWQPSSEDSCFDPAKAAQIVSRNEVMLAETKDTITVPASFMLRVLASLNHFRAGPGGAAQHGSDNSDSS